MITPELIRAIVSQISQSTLTQLTDEEAERLIRVLGIPAGCIQQDIGSVLQNAEYHSYGLRPPGRRLIRTFGSGIGLLLVQQRFPTNSILVLDSITERILGLLEDPEREGQWDRRGLVMGHVQSGKTANYIGLVNKAADAGYKIIIVIKKNAEQSSESDTNPG